jgi:hypothetical protein
MLRLTQGLGWTAPPGGNGAYDMDHGTKVLRDSAGWDGYAANNGGYCAVVNSKTLNDHDIEEIWREVGPDGKGYNADCDCYCYGFKPAYTAPVIIGLGAVAPPFSTTSGGTPAFKVCGGSGFASDGGCKDCAAATLDCPTCPKAPPMLGQQQGGLDEWGTNLGWLLAGAVVAGGGFYAYKKGVFKKGYWKKLGKKARR